MLDLARVLLVGVATLLPALGLAAGVAENIASCRALTDDAARLACFDRLTGGDKVAPSPLVSEPAQPVAPRPPATASKPAGPAATPRAEDFGSEAIRPSVEKQPKLLVSRIVGRVNGVHSGTTFRLENGQVWRSTDDHPYDAEGDSPEVTIDRNFLGNYWMSLTKLGYRFRVRRVQ